MKILDYLKESVLITDGAMGTYYAGAVEKPFQNNVLANIYSPIDVEKIHKEYIESGSKLIRTNTFRANTYMLDGDIEFVRKIISAGCKIAKKVAFEKDVFVGASIGPIPDVDTEVDHTKEYFEIVDTFVSEGIDIFILETFYSLDYVKEIVKYIKSKNRDYFVITQFSVNDTGVTKKSLSVGRIVSELKDFAGIDAIGFNCGVGPLHMINIIKELPDLGRVFVSAMPNAGYPEFIDNKVEYVMNPKYFAKMCAELIYEKVKIIGGCCGTTPEHIRLLKENILAIPHKVSGDSVLLNVEVKKENQDIKNGFHKKLEKGEFVIAVELDPPFKASVDKLVRGAKVLKEKGVDIITIADSPMGKSRADSMVISTRIRREANIEVLPHICCRDRNSISLRSSVLAGYIEGIRNFLVVTGDPVPEELRGSVKSVFDLNSFSLINMIREMNHDIFDSENVKIGGAVNFNVKNKNSEYKRLLKKVESGAEFFLTQPIFTDDTVEFIKRLPKERDFKILGGIMPIVSYRNAQFLNNEMPGIAVSDNYVSKFSSDMDRETAEKIGIGIAVEIAEKIQDYVDGLYIMTPFNRYEMVADILRKLKRI